MPISLSCPTCSTNLRVPDSAAGLTVKCPHCASQFTAPAEAPPPGAYHPREAPSPAPAAGDYDDRPRPRREAAPQSTGVQLGLGIASLAVGALALPFALIHVLGPFSWPLAIAGLVVGTVGIIIACTKDGAGIAFPVSGAAVSFFTLAFAIIWVLLIRPTSSAVDVAMGLEADQFRQAQLARDQMMGRAEVRMKEDFDKGFADKGFPEKGFPDKGGPPLTFGLALVGGVGQVNGELAPNDGRDAQSGKLCKVYVVNLQAGRSYQIDLTNTPFDNYLILQDGNGQMVAQDDDSGGNRNARIVYDCGRSGAYRIIATHFGGGVGQFTLRIQER